MMGGGIETEQETERTFALEAVQTCCRPQTSRPLLTLGRSHSLRSTATFQLRLDLYSHPSLMTEPSQDLGYLLESMELHW